MRIWDINPKYLCREHLLGEHRELHAIWNILTKNKKGYAYHPEVLRWKGKLPALFARHEEEITEMTSRGFKHNSSLKRVKGKSKQNFLIDSLQKQKETLNRKNCPCRF